MRDLPTPMSTAIGVGLATAGHAYGWRLVRDRRVDALAELDALGAAGGPGRVHDRRPLLALTPSLNRPAASSVARRTVSDHDTDHRDAGGDAGGFKLPPPRPQVGGVRGGRDNAVRPEQ
jgi:hypothetical protein